MIEKRGRNADLGMGQNMNVTRRHDSIVVVLDTHTEVAESVRQLRKAGCNMKMLSIAARDPDAQEHVVGYYNAGDVLVEQILENRNPTSREQVMERIESLPPIRRSKVLDIRRPIAEGTYEVANRLDKAIDRVLESLTA